MENEKELRVLVAAQTVFLRHGFRRVTMQDIAEEAGISRPALYLVFPNKEEVFKAAVVQMTAQSLREIGDGLASLPDVEARLNFAFELWTVRPFQLMMASPDAKDLVDCGHGFAKATMQQIFAAFESLLVEILAPAMATAGQSALPVEQIARLLAASVHGFKDACDTVEELRAMIAGMITLTLAGLRP